MITIDHLQVKKLEGEKKKVESDYNATNSRIQVGVGDNDVSNDNDNDEEDDGTKKNMVVCSIW